MVYGSMTYRCIIANAVCYVFHLINVFVCVKK